MNNLPIVLMLAALLSACSQAKPMTPEEAYRADLKNAIVDCEGVVEQQRELCNEYRHMLKPKELDI